jgi:hypothetical protein
MSYTSPDLTATVERYSNAFVDDTQNGLTDAHHSEGMVSTNHYNQTSAHGSNLGADSVLF